MIDLEMLNSLLETNPALLLFVPLPPLLKDERHDGLYGPARLMV